MKQLDLLTQPNQVLSFVENGISWQVKLFVAIDRLLMDVTINQNSVHQGIVCDEKKLMVPYRYQYQRVGNLLFVGAVDYLNFGKTCVLYYLDPDEVTQFKQQFNEALLLKLQNVKKV